MLLGWSITFYTKSFFFSKELLTNDFVKCFCFEAVILILLSVSILRRWSEAMVIVSELKLHNTSQLVLVFRHCCQWAKLVQLSCNYVTSNGVCMPIRLPLGALHPTRRREDGILEKKKKKNVLINTKNKKQCSKLYLEI